MPKLSIPAAAEGLPTYQIRPMPGLLGGERSASRRALAGLLLAMTITPAIAAEHTGSVGLVSPAAFAERDDFSRADVTSWAVRGLSRPNCLAQAIRMQKQGRPAICFLD